MPTLETRKVFSTGSSQAIVIPKGWLKYYKIQNGEELTIISDGDLIIKSPKELKKRV